MLAVRYRSIREVLHFFSLAKFNSKFVHVSWIKPGTCCLAWSYSKFENILIFAFFLIMNCSRTHMFYHSTDGRYWDLTKDIARWTSGVPECLQRCNGWYMYPKPSLFIVISILKKKIKNCLFVGNENNAKVTIIVSLSVIFNHAW